MTGETKNRQEIVNQFQEDESPSVFLLSLRAAGTGLNLTSASYVVIYDPRVVNYHVTGTRQVQAGAGCTQTE